MRKKILHFMKMLSSFLIFFALIAFVVTCCFLLFLSSMDLDVSLVTRNAKMTFINVIFLAVLLSTIDYARRKLTVDRTVKRITKSLKEITSGNFDVQIKTVPGWIDSSNLNVVIKDINIMTKELSGLETLRSDFVSSVSHEIKTPLAVIKNYAMILQDESLETERRIECAKAIAEASGNLAGMVTNVLKLSKLENQQIFPVSSEYDLSEQLRECVLGFESEWERKKLEIEIDIPDEVFIKADAELYSLVWNNLLSNAVKFTEAGDRITVTLKEESGTVLVSVSDTGCGISAKVGKHIFEKFYQGDTSRATQGNGLGLALVKRVIDIMGSEISLESTLGVGSTFTVKISK